MPKQLTNNSDGYNQWSTFYDTYPNPTVAIDELNFPKVYQELSGTNILEIGCGTGRHTTRLIEAGNYVVGVDISAGMLTRLKEKIKHPSLELINGDFLETVFADSSFDAIVASLVLEHIFDLEAFFDKSAKLLRPAGRIFLSEIHPYRTAKGTFAHFKNPDGTEAQLTSAAHTESSIQSTALRSGFSVKEITTVKGDSTFAEINPRWSKYEGIPMIQIWVFQLA